MKKKMKKKTLVLVFKHMRKRLRLTTVSLFYEEQSVPYWKHSKEGIWDWLQRLQVKGQILAGRRPSSFNPSPVLVPCPPTRPQDGPHGPWGMFVPPPPAKSSHPQSWSRQDSRGSWPGQELPPHKWSLNATSAENSAEIQLSLSDIKPSPAYNHSGGIFLHSKMDVGKLWYTFKISYFFT